MKVQIITDGSKRSFEIENLEWVKTFASSIKKYYPNFDIDSLEVLQSDQALELNADLYIYPINLSEIKVGFKPTLLCFDSNKKLTNGLHSINITCRATPNSDTLSMFLILVLGLVVLPSGMGNHYTDLADLQTVMQQGKYATLTNPSNISSQKPEDILSLAVWFNCKGKFSKNFNQINETLANHFKGRDLLTIVNVTKFLILKETNLVLMVTTEK